jgi:predicted NBD/HSP70 family sugar kinase
VSKRSGPWTLQSALGLSGSLVPINQLGPADQASVRRRNVSLVLGYLCEHGPASRAGVAAGTGLTKATVSNLMPDLLARGLVQESGKDQRTGAGRRGEQLRLAQGGIATIGVELNVGWIHVIGADLSGNVVYDAVVDHDNVHFGAESTIDVLGEATALALMTCRRDGLRVAGVTLAIPGSVDPASGVVRWSPYIDWHHVDLRAGLHARVEEMPPICWLDSTRNLALMAECWSGAARTAHDVVYLNGAVGVGAGVLVGRSVLRGTGGMGGEIGHIPLNPSGPRCGCGRHGCWETLVGMPALVRQAGLGAPWSEMVGRSRLSPVLDEIARRAEAEDKAVTAALEELGSWLGIGAAVVVNILNPELVVLGGYFGILARYLLPRALREMRRHVADPRQTRCRVVAGQVGLRAAAVGGAEIVRRAILADPSLLAGTPA